MFDYNQYKHWTASNIGLHCFIGPGKQNVKLKIIFTF